MVALKIFAALLIALAALACTAPQPTPAPAPTVAPAAAVVPTLTATASPTDTPTPQPTPTATTLPPTATPTPLPTNTPAPTATPQPTATPIPTPTRTPRPTFTPQPTSTPTPQLAAMRVIQQLPWVADGVAGDNETVAHQYLRGTAQRAPEQAKQMLELSWVQDDITETEATALKELHWISRRNADAAAALIAMPFLESVEIRDTLALRALSHISWRDANDRVVDITFSELMSLPKIKDGITDEDTKIVAVLGGHTYSRSPGSARVLLAEDGVYIEERLIELPHTGETLLAVIRVEDKATPSMDNFEHAVRTIEEFMGVPYPINYLALLFYDREDQNANNNFTHLHMMPKADEAGPQRYAGVIAHEAAHWYWRNDGEGYQYQNWITEGSADFLRVISEHKRVGRPLKPIKSPCTFFDNISELEKANPDRTFIPGQSTPRECYYSLGNRFFLDLYLALGEETFRPAFRTLYLKSQQDDPGDGCGDPRLNICRVAAAFKDGASAEVVRKVDEVIARWYGPLP